MHPSTPPPNPFMHLKRPLSTNYTIVTPLSIYMFVYMNFEGGTYNIQSWGGSLLLVGGLWTLSFELSQFHGHGSQLMCEVALRALEVQRLEVYWDGLWTLSAGLSHFHGHGARLKCEVVLRVLEVQRLEVCWDGLWDTFS